MNLIRIAAVVAMVCLSSACSIKFAYNNVDRLVRWQVNDYFDLDAAQRDYLDDQVAQLMAWHRVNHLPQYAEFMTDLSMQLSDGVTEPQLEAIFDRLFVWGDEIEQRGMPVAIEILSSLSDEQVAALPARLEKSNLEWAEDEADITLEVIQKRWANDLEDVLERFTGRLQRPQRDYIARRATAYQPERTLWADYRRRWQADMLALLDKRADKTLFAEEFIRLVDARESYYGERFTRISDENNRLGREVAAYVLSNLSDKQSERFVDSLQELAEDFAELSTQV